MKHVLRAILIIGCCLILFGYFSTPGVYPLCGFLGSCESSSSSGSHDQLSVIPDYTKPISMDTRWVRDLRHAVKQLTGRQVTLLVCDKNYLEVLVNWLIHSILYASQPVESILIVAFDSFTHRVLQSKGFHSVYIAPDAVINSNPTSKFLAYIWVTRLTIIRMLNHWNYNVFVIDSDAIMMKNIQPLLDKLKTSDIIASGGYFPPKYHDKWNAPTMCMGTILIKSSPATEQFWLSIRAVKFSVDDQMRVNRGLDSMGVQWRQLNDKSYQGITGGKIPLKITTLPSSVICRVCGSKLPSSYYIWHQHGGNKNATRKKTSLYSTDIWMLKDNWNSSLWDSTLTSEQWLKDISNSNRNHG